MHLFRFSAGLLAAMITLGGGVISAEAAGDLDAASEAVTLDRALQMALEANAEVRLAERSLAAAQARRLQADGFDAPTFFYDAEEVEGSNPSRFGSQKLGVEQQFDWPGKRRNLKQAADVGVEAARAALERARLRTVARVRKTFDEALVSAEASRLLEGMVERMGEAVALSRVRFQSGAGQYLDVLRTRIARERARSDLREAQLAAAAARRRLSVLLGRRESGITPIGELAPPPLPADIPRRLTDIDANSPSAVLVARRIEEADRRLEAARQGRYPDITLTIAQQRLYSAGEADNAWAGGVGLRLPLPGSDRQHGLEAEALAQAQAAQDRARALRLVLQGQLRQRADEAAKLEEQIRAYREVTLLDAEDQLKAAQQEYRVRRIDALNLLDVYNTYIEISRTYLDMVARYRAAVADIETWGEDLWEIDS